MSERMRRTVMRGTEAWKSVWPSLLGGALAAATLVWAAASDPFVSGLQMLLAQATNGLLRLLGQATTVVGTTVQSSQFGISVVTACTGLFATGLFVVAVAAFPTRWRAKLAGVALGVVCIFAINLVRLVSLYFVGVHWPQILDAVHLLIWQSLLIALAVALWSVWAGRVTVIRRRGAR